MKKNLLLLMIFVVNFMYSQTNIYPVNNYNCVENVLSQVYFYKCYKKKNHIYNIYMYTNPSSIANTEGTDEVTSSIIISKSEYGENETAIFFEIKGLINPKIINLYDDSDKILIDSGIKQHRLRQIYTFSK